jgi:two-component system, OmpR family, sensor histidine kinase QseC
LRTPIAAIRAQAQVALHEAHDDARRHALQATLQGCDRATRLVEQLLTLARLEAQEEHAPSAVRAAPADLRRVAQQVAADLAPAALARGQTLELEADSRCLVQADDSLLAVLVRNLLDNALRYSPPLARVHLSVHQDAATAVLSVEDSGPGLDTAAQARLGERFFRPEGQDAPGSGLGWSIVRRIAQVQRAVVTVGRSTALGGLSVQVRWPAREAGTAQ